MARGIKMFFKTVIRGRAMLYGLRIADINGVNNGGRKVPTKVLIIKVLLVTAILHLISGYLRTTYNLTDIEIRLAKLMGALKAQKTTLVHTSPPGRCTICSIGWPLFLNSRIFNFSPPHFVHYYKKVIFVKFDHDCSPPSRVPKGLKNVLSVLFFNMRKVNLNLRDSAKLVIREVIIFWEKARSPVREEYHLLKKVESLYNEWRNLQKHSTRKSTKDRKNEEIFVNKLNDIFDIAHERALDIMKIECDKQFLIAQRTKGRPGCLLGIDRKNQKLEECYRQPNLFQLRGKTNFITDKMAATLDRCKISDRDTVHILLAPAESFGININELIINRTSALRVNFNPSQICPCVVHWDGKLLPSLSEKKLVDRLPIIISYKGIEQLLGVPELISGTGENQATAVYQVLENWGLTDNVQALCCDTTASNTGRLKGACILLEQKLEREILYLPCRHHILEVVLRSAFEIKIDIASAPDVPIFKRFQKCWPNINVNNFHIGLEDTFVFQSLQNLKDELLIFCINQLKQYQPRDDYKELLELTIIFLGQTPPNAIFFKVPGPIHHARWMSKAIYSIKIFLFRNEFKLTLKENNALRDLCIFIVRIYIKQWFCARAAALAPNMDLQFIKDIILYEVIDEQISKSALKKMCGHLWYLTLEATSLAFFDDKVSSQTKIKMVKAMQSRDIESEANKRIILKPNEIYDYAKKDINDFISIQSSNFFNRFGIPMDFLDLDPKLWNENDQYKKSKELVNNINVVNDIVERGVKLIEDYNKLLTKNEDQKQYLLQVVSEYRQQFSDCKKSTLSKSYLIINNHKYHQPLF
ncbi:hypothetical protein QTP88_026257 [Uroleucon formosanum]